jgi:hypothetical protein
MQTGAAADTILTGGVPNMGPGHPAIHGTAVDTEVAPNRSDAMIGIIPRWEWRTFGDRFRTAEDAFAAMTPTGVQESDELYLLSESGDNVKVRDDLMDVKARCGPWPFTSGASGTW